MLVQANCVVNIYYENDSSQQTNGRSLCQRAMGVPKGTSLLNKSYLLADDLHLLVFFLIVLDLLLFKIVLSIRID